MKFLLLIFLSISIGSCTTSRTVSEAAKEMQAEQVRIDPSWVMPPTSAPVTIKEIQFDSNIMEVAVSYSGGCGEHLFELWTTGEFSNRYPPQLNIFLFHNNMGDACREIQNKTLYFDVTTLQYPGTNAVMLRFDKLNKSVKYAY